MRPDSVELESLEDLHWLSPLEGCPVEGGTLDSLSTS